MRALQLAVNLLRRGLPLAQVLAILALAAALAPATARAQEIKIGGTGGALATMQMLADAYRENHPEAKITILPSLGSSGGIKAVLAGAIQIAVSSRALKPAETSQGANAYECGRTPFVFAVSVKNAADSITVKDVVDIYSGARERWPDGIKIRLVLRPVGDSDSDMVKSISPEVRQAKTAAEKRPGMLFAITDQEAADHIENIPGAFGASTLAQIVTEQRAIKPLRFNGVEPSAKTLADGRYPYYKPLFIVTSPKTPASAQQFVTFVRSAAGREILARTGYWVN
jgi:phosphate transport system substrate-binding protein